MKNFLIVLKFELLNLIRKKAFIVSTTIICLLIIVGLTIPTIMDSFGSPILGRNEDQAEIYGKINYGVLIENGSIDLSSLKAQLPDSNIIIVGTKEEIKDLIMFREIEAGLI